MTKLVLSLQNQDLDLVDDVFSGYCGVYFSKVKDSVTICENCGMFQSAINCKICRLRRDNGTKNLSKYFQDMIRGNSTMHETTAPCSAKQNGQAEHRFHVLFCLNRTSLNP